MASRKIFKKLKYALRVLPDKAYIQLYYFARFHRLCNLKEPKTFNEKLQWLKLYDRRPEYTGMVDKYEVKKYVADKIGSEYIIPTLGVWDRFDDIDFDALPERFVLKCTHDSEGLVIVKDKKTLDRAAAKEKLESAMKQNFYYIGREWVYKNVKPRIIAEEYVEDHATGELRDYKFFCFDGTPKAMFTASGRSAGTTKFDFFDLDYKNLGIKQHYPNSEVLPQKPQNFEKMKELAAELSRKIPHVRVDFYEADGKLLFGELTFSHFGGFMPFDTPEWDRTFGEWLRLPDKKRNGKEN